MSNIYILGGGWGGEGARERGKSDGLEIIVKNMYQVKKLIEHFTAIYLLIGWEQLDVLES